LHLDRGTIMNRLRAGYICLVLVGATAFACSSNNATSTSGKTDTNGTQPGAASSSGSTDLDSGDPGSSGGVGGPGGVGVVTPPPPGVKCGVGQADKCELGGACATTDDCKSGICGEVGASKGVCISAFSCTGGDGADFKCGPGGNEDCCHTIPVPGGSFTNYNYDAIKPEDPNGQKRPSAATVSAFALDEFEVTVGRLRAFYTAKAGNPRGAPPKAGDGAHPLHPESGWRDSFNERLPGSWTEINARMTTGCAEGGDNANWGATTWTADPGPNEQKPANCVDWYTAMAFCAWDGGRMPMDVEWSYVAYGGDKELVYPFGDQIGGQTPTFDNSRDVVVTSFLAYPDAGYGLYTEGPEYRQQADGPAHISKVGEKSGRSPWGHADMGGNVIEFLAEVAQGLPGTCNNCAVNLQYPDPPPGQEGLLPVQWQAHDADGGNLPGDDFSDDRAAPDGKRLARGGSWMGEFEGHILDNIRSRYWYPVWRNYQAAGLRCARNVK
jgi:formylglycine-generating enzyme required for sulfatase activity